MKASIGIAVLVSILTVAGHAAGQGMLLDVAADKVIAKYEAATCEPVASKLFECGMIL